MASSESIKTTLCRLAYAQTLFVARLQDEKKPDGPKKYGCTLIFSNSDVEGRALLEKLALDTIKAEWGDKGVSLLAKKLIKTPFCRGDGEEARYKKGERAGELHPGMGPDVWFIRVSANEKNKDGILLPPPFVWYRDRDAKGDLVRVGEDVAYSGCYGKGILNAFTSNHDTGGMRVSFGISGFKKIKDGERLGGNGGVAADPEKWDETIADEGPVPETAKSGGGAASLFGD